ncbi:transcriptional regulator BetI [Nitrincola sp. MINF-07-Sa-05]|uniref:transcriptional regulator BetI n=1 Tax=Nitrincola salilacus TaxID=3400273 RepID=UPI00391827DD
MKTSIGQIRRKDLTKAAYYVMLEHGLAGTTVARVGEKAGMSHGIVNYHFKNKVELLNAVVRYANRLIGDRVVSLMREARTPREKLSAVLRGNFDEEIFKPENARAWLALYAQSPKSPGFVQLQNLIYSRLQSNLVCYLKKLMPQSRALEVSRGLSLMMDGLWLQQAMDDCEVPCPLALSMTESYLDCMIEKYRADH